MKTDCYGDEVLNLTLEREQNQIFVKCIGDQQAIFICTSENCHMKNIFNCGIEDCKCQTQHEPCSKTKVKSILKEIQKKSLSSDLLKKSIEQSFDKIIDQLSDIRDKLLEQIDTKIKFAGHSEVQKDFLAIINGAKLQQVGYFDSKKSALLLKVVNEKNFEPSDLLDQGKKSLKKFEQSCTLNITNFKKELDGMIKKEILNQKKRLSKNQVLYFDFQNQMQKLKSKISLNNPSLEDTKSIIRLSLKASRIESAKIQQRFKNERRKFNKQKRNLNFEQYVRMFVQKDNQLKQKDSQSYKKQITTKIGIKEDQIDQYHQQMSQFEKEQINFNNEIKSFSTQLSLKELKKIFDSLNEYMSNNTNGIAEKFYNVSKDWPLEERAVAVGSFLQYIFDQVFENQPEIDLEKMSSAQQKFQEEIKQKNAQFNQALSRIFQKLFWKFLASSQRGMFESDNDYNYNYY